MEVTTIFRIAVLHRQSSCITVSLETKQIQIGYIFIFGNIRVGRVTICLVVSLRVFPQSQLVNTKMWCAYLETRQTVFFQLLACSRFTRILPSHLTMHNLCS
jgi:hypothetical protein